MMKTFMRGAAVAAGLSLSASAFAVSMSFDIDFSGGDADAPTRTFIDPTGLTVTVTPGLVSNPGFASPVLTSTTTLLTEAGGPGVDGFVFQTFTPTVITQTGGGLGVDNGFGDGSDLIDNSGLDGALLFSFSFDGAPIDIELENINFSFFDGGDAFGIVVDDVIKQIESAPVAVAPGSNFAVDPSLVGTSILVTTLTGEGDEFRIEGLAGQFTVPTSQVPEPASLALLGLGLAGVGIARRRKAA